MEKHRKDSIYERVQSDFGVNVFRRYYYCSGLSLENFKRKLKIRHGQECRILVRFDHIVVEESEGEIIVYLLVSHNSGNVLTFFIKVKLIVLFIFMMAECKRRILESMSCSHLAIKKMEALFLFSSSFLVFLFFHFSFFIEHIIIHLGYVNWPRVLFKSFPLDISHIYDYIV